MNERLTRLEVRMDNVEKVLFEVKREVGSLRWWIDSSFLAVFFGFSAIVIGFSQIQTSWLQHSLSQQESKFEALITSNEKKADAKIEQLEKNLERFEKNMDLHWQRSQETLDKIHALELRMANPQKKSGQSF